MSPQGISWMRAFAGLSLLLRLNPDPNRGHLPTPSMGYPSCVPLIDVHSHYWEYPTHFSEDFKTQAKRARGDVEVDLTVRWEDYAAQARGCDKTIVFGGKAKLSGLWVPDREVAAYTDLHPDRLIGFLSLDLSQPGWQDE